MRKIIKVRTKKLEDKLNLRQGWQIEGIKFATADPCAGACQSQCDNRCNFWQENWSGAWGPSSEMINTWVTCSS